MQHLRSTNYRVTDAITLDPNGGAKPGVTTVIRVYLQNWYHQVLKVLVGVELQYQNQVLKHLVLELLVLILKNGTQIGGRRN